MAAALGLPGLVLWGESPLEVWRPRHQAMECLLAGTRLSQLEVAEVWTALAPRLFAKGSALECKSSSWTGKESA